MEVASLHAVCYQMTVVAEIILVISCLYTHRPTTMEFLESQSKKPLMLRSLDVQRLKKVVSYQLGANSLLPVGSIYFAKIRMSHVTGQTKRPREVMWEWYNTVWQCFCVQGEFYSGKASNSTMTRTCDSNTDDAPFCSKTAECIEQLPFAVCIIRLVRLWTPWSSECL